MMESALEDRKVRIALVDDHPVVRAGFARAIQTQQDLQIVGEASTASEALTLIAELQVDVVVVDLQLPDRDGPDLISALREVVPGARLVVLSGCDDEYRVIEALRAGAHGYLLKTAPIDEILDGIRSASAGGSPISASLADCVLRSLRKPVPGTTPGALDVLSSREIQVLRLFALGRNTREVAASLGISAKTVETHRMRIFGKLGVKGIVDLTRLAVRAGLIQV